jgi:hypothetical protein
MARLLYPLESGYDRTGIASTHRSICRVENWSEKGGVLRIPKCCFRIGFSCPDYSYDLLRDRQLMVVYAGLQAIDQTKKSRVAFSPQSKPELRRREVR